ncbi:MAG: hypothetical protein GXX10_10730 [Clostridiaceae bacterium]|nr:hypothetical protein [Clostridiaceae bacterium]
MKINLTDDLLKEAVTIADIREFEALPMEHEIEYEFSKSFNKRMKKLISRSSMDSSDR